MNLKRTCQRGVTVVEYAILLMLIAAACVLGLKLVGSAGSAKLNTGANGIGRVTTTVPPTTTTTVECHGHGHCDD